MGNTIYQVLLSDKSKQTVTHIGYFRLHAFATECMRELAKTTNKDQTIYVWQNTLFESGWDGNVNIREELTRGLNDDTNP